MADNKITGSIITNAATGYWDEDGYWQSITNDWPTQVILQYEAQVNSSNKIQVDYTLVSSAGDGDGYKWVKMGQLDVILDGVTYTPIEGRDTVYQNEILWTKTVTYDASNSGKTINIAVKAAIYSGSFNCFAEGSFNLPIADLTVTFDKNGGDSVSPSSKTVTLNETYGSLPTPTRTGYTFEGWYTASTGGTEVTKDTKVVKNENHTLYAHWKANTYTVSFDTNASSTYPAGTLNKTSMTVTYGSAYGTLPTIKVSDDFPYPRKGFRFDGWYTAKTGGTEVTKDTKVSIAKNHTLYAHWTAYTITIKYYSNGGDSATLHKKEIDVNKVLIDDHSIAYDVKDSEGLWNCTTYETLEVKKYKHRPKPNKEWNTAKNGSGTSINQATGYTGKELAYHLGRLEEIEIGNITQNVYVNWEPYGVMRIYVKDQGWRLGVPYVYSKSHNAWKETFPYIYDTKFGDSKGWKPGQ